MLPLERTRLEKALADHGFDLMPVFEANWLIGCSTQHLTTVWLRIREDGTIALAGDNIRVRSALIKEGYVCDKHAVLPASVEWQVVSSEFAIFYRLLGRVAALARSLPNQVAKRFANVTKSLPKSTEAERLVVQRIGQNLFREALIDYWQGRCVVTGIDIVSLLRASHIKPWAACDSDEERLDVFNGLLLAPHFDAMFDGGWITFSEAGEMQVSPHLTSQQQAALGLTMPWATLRLSPEHQANLSYHRDLIFKG